MAETRDPAQDGLAEYGAMDDFQMPGTLDPKIEQLLKAGWTPPEIIGLMNRTEWRNEGSREDYPHGGWEEYLRSQGLLREHILPTQDEAKVAEGLLYFAYRSPEAVQRIKSIKQAGRLLDHLGENLYAFLAKNRSFVEGETIANTELENGDKIEVKMSEAHDGYFDVVFSEKIPGEEESYLRMQAVLPINKASSYTDQKDKTSIYLSSPGNIGSMVWLSHLFYAFEERHIEKTLEEDPEFFSKPIMQLQKAVRVLLSSPSAPIVPKS